MRFSIIVAPLLLGCFFVYELSAQPATPVPVYRWTTLVGRASIGNEDGPVNDARFNSPHGLVFDLAGNLFVADTGNHTIRKITPAGMVTTFAGKSGEPGNTDGAGSTARFKNPQGIAVDHTGNVYVADTGNHTIRLITPAGVVSTLAGQPGNAGNADGATGSALFNAPRTLTVDMNGTVYLFNDGLRKIAGGGVQTVPLPAVNTSWGQTYLAEPVGGPAVDTTGRIYFFDKTNRILRLDTAGNLTEFPSGGFFMGYAGMVFNDVNGVVYWVRAALHSRDRDRHFGGRLPPDGSYETPNTTFDDEYGYGVKPLGIAVNRHGVWYNTRPTDHAVMRGTEVYAGTARSGLPVDGIAGSARFESIYDLASDPAGNIWVQETNFHLYSLVVSQGFTYAHSLRKINAADKNVTTPFAPVFLSYTPTPPRGVGIDETGKPYVAQYNDYVYGRPTVIAALTRETVGPDTPVEDFAVDASGNMWAYVGLGRILRRPLGGAWAEVAGGGSYLDEPRDGQGASARLGKLRHLTFDAEGNCYALAHYAEWANPDNKVHTCFIRRITPSGAVTTIGQDLVRKSGPVDAPVAEYPSGLALNGANKFIVTYRHEVVQLDAQGNALTLGGTTGESGSADGLGGRARFDFPGSVIVDQKENLLVADGDGTTVRKGEYLGHTPGIRSQPQSVTIAAGGSVTFSVTPNDTPDPTYQWYFNDTPFAGGTGPTLSFTHARASDAGDYHVVITNALGSVISAKARLLVTATPAPPPPAPGGGGGGAPSAWFLGTVAALGLARRFILRST